MKEKYCVSEVAKLLGLTSGRMVSELIQKHFGKNSMEFTNSGTGGKIKKHYKITHEQLIFILSRSRGNVDACIKHYGIDLKSICLMRNEQLFSSLVIELIKVTDLKYESQYMIRHEESYYLLDLIVYGMFGCVVVEYDERGHNTKGMIGSDAKRDIIVIDGIKEKLNVDRVEIIRVKDNQLSFASYIGKINEMIHGDYFQPIEYKLQRYL